MSDNNYHSFENETETHYEGWSLEPTFPLNFDDTMKVFRCNRCTFTDFKVDGGKEDCIDIGRESSGNKLTSFKLKPNGRYAFTIKGESNGNEFYDIELLSHGKDADIEIGNWSTYNYEKSTGNTFGGIYAKDKEPITYCYRLGCKPVFQANANVKHLWWRSIGLTFYWWFKYVKHVVFKMHDNMGK